MRTAIVSLKNKRHLPMQMVIWTIGPSLPTLRPAATDSMMPIDLISKVHFPKKPRIIKPLKIVFICTVQLTKY